MIDAAQDALAYAYTANYRPTGPRTFGITMKHVKRFHQDTLGPCRCGCGLRQPAYLDSRQGPGR
jgi:hypothetical protein